MHPKLFKKCGLFLFQQAEFQGHDYLFFRNSCCSTGKDCDSHVPARFHHFFGVFRTLHQSFVLIAFTSSVTLSLHRLTTWNVFWSSHFWFFEEFGWSFAPIDNFHKYRWILNALAYNALGVCLYTYLSFFWSNEIFEGIAYKFIRQFWRNKSQFYLKGRRLVKSCI